MNTMEVPTLKTGALVLALVISTSTVHAQTTLNLDANPSFDFGNDPPTDPLFAPEMLGLTNGTVGFNQVAAVSAFAAEAENVFPPSREVFIAYWGNPRYALLTDPAASPAALAATSPLSLASAFRPPGTILKASPVLYKPGTVVPGRGNVLMVADGTRVSLSGQLYELPAPLSVVSPLVLDLNGDGLLSASRGLWLTHPAKLTGPYAAFDMDGDGFKEVTEWIGAGDGLLVTSTNPTSGRDLVGTAGGWKDGFQHLAARYDLDHNGWLEGAELNGLYVWQDANTNGLAEPAEVLAAQSARIDGIAVTDSGDYTASFRYADGSTGRLWDWWPNYALANRRAARPIDSGHPLLGQDAMTAIRQLVFGRVVDDNSPPRTASLAGPIHIPPAQLTAAGVDLGSFRVASLADGGRAIIGIEATGSSQGRPDRARLICIRIDAAGNATQRAVELPFEEVYQLATSPSGDRVLVLGNQGSQLSVVDFDGGTVAPVNGLDLRSVGLRASGPAGNASVRFAGTGIFWFSGWQLDNQDAVVDERVWAVTPWGFWGGLSLEALKNELGQLRSYFITGPTSGFFAVPGPGETNEQLWSIVGTNRVLVDQADSFGGMHATQHREDGVLADQVTYSWRKGEVYGWDYWQSGCAAGSDTCHVAIATSSVPYFYPFLTDGGGTAIAAQLDPGTATIHMVKCRQIHALPPGRPDITPLLTTYPGQGKVSQGAFAHYGTNGIDLFPVPDPALSPLPDQVCKYSLLPGSQLQDECLICGRPPILVSLRGTFHLRLLQANPLFSTYAVEDLSFDAGSPPGATYKVRGKGIYHVGGEVGLLQDMFLEVQIDDGRTNQLCYFTNAVSTMDRLWPMIHLTLDQTNGTELQTFELQLNAAPLRQIWFSTASGMTPSEWLPPTNHVSPGDLISSAGRIVKRNGELTRNLGLQPSPDPPDLGLDAVDVLTNGEIVFSLEQDLFSETLGQLQHGDLLSVNGRIVSRNQDLTRAFVILPPVPDVGLDAVHVRDDGEIHFSIETPIFSGTGGRLGRGDLLSNRGLIVKSNAQLLARFHPPQSNYDYGLDALYVWPSGEVWFSLEEGFQDGTLGPIQRGDLLSDQGYVVYGNLDLVSAFAPVEDASDFGLDALYILPGATPWLEITPTAGGLVLEWDAPLAVLQEADHVTGPWRDVSPNETPGSYRVPSPLGTKFYCLREP